MSCAGKPTPRPSNTTDYYAEEMADTDAVDFHQRKKDTHYGAVEPDAVKIERKRYAGGTGSYPLIGRPERIADEVVRMHRLGLSGATLSFVNFNEELPFFVARVLPLLEQAGLRTGDVMALRRGRAQPCGRAAGPRREKVMRKLRRWQLQCWASLAARMQVEPTPIPAASFAWSCRIRPAARQMCSRGCWRRRWARACGRISSSRTSAAPPERSAPRSVARAAPDGYTLIFGYATQFTIAPALYQNLSYDPIASFTPIGSAVRFHFLMTAYSALPASSLSELVAHAKANPGKLTFASPGVGTSTHLVGELLKLKAGIDIVHVPYRGGGPAITDYVAGRIDTLLGRDCAAAAVGCKREDQAAGRHFGRACPDLPNVPTVIEAGLPDLNVFTWTGVFAPAGTPAATSQQARSRIAEGARRQGGAGCFSQDGYELFPGSPASVTQLIRNDLAKWTAV